jgi:nicotinate-nucleotide adenylyltransferase
MQIGLYFGSFNPIHTGHLIIANHVLHAVALKQIWFVVSPHNPLKETSSLLNENDRLHLVQLAIEDNTKFKASNIEFKLPRPSYTIDTLTYLTEKYPQHEFTIIMGGDSIQNIKKWKNYETLLANYKLVIYQRPGFDSKPIQQENITYLQSPFLDISSTYIRNKIKQKQSIKYLVAPTVEEYILANKYYTK